VSSCRNGRNKKYQHGKLVPRLRNDVRDLRMMYSGETNHPTVPPREFRYVCVYVMIEIEAAW